MNQQSGATKSAAATRAHQLQSAAAHALLNNSTLGPMARRRSAECVLQRASGEAKSYAQSPLGKQAPRRWSCGAVVVGAHRILSAATLEPEDEAIGALLASQAASHAPGGGYSAVVPIASTSRLASASSWRLSEEEHSYDHNYMQDSAEGVAAAGAHAVTTSAAASWSSQSSTASAKPQAPWLRLCLEEVSKMPRLH